MPQFPLFSQLQTLLHFSSKTSQFSLPKSYFYNRRMNQMSSSLHLQKLISKLKLQQPLVRKSETKATNFAKYNKPQEMPYLSVLQHSYRSFRNTRVEKFKKHSNLVQANKENVVRLHTSKPNREYLNAPTNESYKNTARSQVRKTTLLTSGSEERIQVNPGNLETLLRKNSMKNNRNLLGQNILQLEKKYNISRFQLYSLHSAYKTLLLDSRQSLGRFRDSFEVMLNMNKIIIRPQELQRIFREQGSITFQAFITMYGKIDRAIVKESIVDYVRIIFDGVFDKDRIRFEDIIRLLKTRITDKQAFDIAKVIFQQNQRDFDGYITLAEILELCQSCENFSKKMYRLYSRQAKLD